MAPKIEKNELKMSIKSKIYLNPFAPPKKNIVLIRHDCTVVVCLHINMVWIWCKEKENEKKTVTLRNPPLFRRVNFEP